MEQLQSYRDAGSHHLDTNESCSAAIERCLRAEEIARSIVADIREPALRKSVAALYTAVATVVLGVITALAAAGIASFAD